VQRLPLILGAAAFGALALAAPAGAACKPGGRDAPFGPAIIYDGKVGGEPARFALIFRKDGSVEGRYALATSPAEIFLRGKIEPGGERMTLAEFDEHGRPRAEIAAVFPDETKLAPMIAVQGKDGVVTYRSINPSAGPPPAGAVQFQSSPGCGKFGGSRQEAGGVQQKLDLSSNRRIEHPQFGHLYAIAGVTDDEIVNRHAQAFRQAVVDGRPEDVARHIRLPMTFTVRGKLVVIANARELKARFDDVFPQATRDGLAALVPRMMEANESGITLRNMWFDSEGYLIAF
jgi:hypothetical protein